MNKCKTYWVNICVGMKVGYDGRDILPNEVIGKVKHYVNNIENIGVTVTFNEILYPQGHEKGATIGLINYPRYPKKRRKLWNTAVHLARYLREELQQERVTVVSPHDTLVIEKGD